MKNFLLAVMICVGFSFSAGAQSKFSLGPNVGLGASWISNTPNSKSQLSGNAGLSLVYSAAEHFGIGLDAKYTFEGGRSTESGVTTSSDLNYIRVPLKAIYFFNNYGNRVRPKVYVGPSFGFLVGGETEVERNGATVATLKSRDVYEHFDLGVTAGAGLNIRISHNTWFNGDVNYLHGIKDIRNNTDTHNRNVGVNLGVNFGL